ncbi:MAG: leucine-rich repeat protein, partial [Spirochaetaceae bacterium]|nr:leucine-rich repeat protein [Spirochaetaceae bacterium]
MSKLVILVAALFSAFFVIFSCSNLFDNINVDSPVSSETVTLTGIVSTSGRMALPSGSFAATRYTVSATASGAEPVTGSVNDSNKTFSIGLKLGKKWTITLVMEASESTDPTPPESSFNNVFEGTYAFDHDLTIDDVTTPLNIVLVPLSTGSGKINLPISVASNVSVNTIDISGLSASPETYTLSDGSYTIYKIGVPCGAYTVTIDFKNSAGMLVYSTAQTINVFPNMTTDRWVSSGSSGPISSDGTFLVTSALVQAFAQTQIYVGANPYRMHEPSDTNLGTPYAPLATFAAALTRITDSSKDYTIHISGTQQNFTYSITSDFDSKMKSLTLCGMTGNTTDILYGPASGTVLVIATTKPVTIKNLKITNGNAGYKGGGIQMSAGTDVTLGTGALITGNRAFQKGGGVYVEGTSSSKAKLTIENGAEISANTLTSLSNSDGGFGLYAENAIISMTGGSICNHDGTGFSNANDAPRGTVRLKNTQFTMTGGKITGNKVIKIGGNLFVDANTQFTIDGGEISYGTIENNSDDSCGAGMWIQGENSSNKGTVTLKSGKIIGNVATSANPSAGGGVFIYNYGRFIVEGGEISGNSAEKGGAVFVATSGEFKIKGSASIPAGVNGSTGVGNNDVYLDTDAKITISGALEGTASVATITPKTTSEDLAVVVKESGVSDADFAAACRKIAVNSTEYILGSDGKLKPGVVTTPANAGTSISNITESSTVVLTGTISSDNWSDINESLQDLADEHSDVKVAIDLSGVTNLTTLPVTSFMGCTNLESVTLPDTLTSIANGSCTWDSANSVYNYTGAFYGCTSLTSVELPDGLTTIGTSAFCGCENLESINLPSGLTTIGKNAFEGCSSLSSVDIPDTVTRINDMAFKGCSSITEVELPDTMTYIGQHAFMNCTNLAEVNIPSGVTTLYQSAFANTAITSIEIPNTVRTLGGCVFFGTNLTSVTIPSSVTSIGMQCFNDCKDLESVTFENGCSITSLSDGVFGGCSKLTSIEIPSTVTSIADSAFSGCTVLSNITIPNSVTSIGERVFMGCQALTSIEIPANVTSLGKYLFQGCSSLATVILNHSDEALTID